MFRIRNDFGGFWGSGVTFSVRQLYLKGVVGDVLRYQVGDLNLKQTPFTLYNHNADRIDSLPAIFNLQTQIVQYERFYKKNTWRQQGVNLDFGFKFAKYIHELYFSGYTTRLQATDFGIIPDRLMSGVSVNLSQSKHLKVGFNGSFSSNLRVASNFLAGIFTLFSSFFLTSGDFVVLTISSLNSTLALSTSGINRYSP